MKGASYGITLMVILLTTNLMLYIYGVDVAITDWLGVGVQTSGTGTSYQPLGGQVGNFTSTSGMNKMILQLSTVIVGVTILGITTTVFFGTQWINWGIPLAMIMMLLITFISPMGQILLPDVTLEGMACYKMRAGIMRFGQTINTECLPWEVHVILAIFFGVMILATFMSFIRGTEW
jgi:hypothetical protein